MLATTVISVFGALGFGLKAEAIADTLKWSTRFDWQHAWLTVAFSCVAIDFLMGALWYMGERGESMSIWREDLYLTCVTLSGVVALGVIAVPQRGREFLAGLGLFSAFQLAWIAWRGCRNAEGLSFEAYVTRHRIEPYLVGNIIIAAAGGVLYLLHPAYPAWMLCLMAAACLGKLIYVGRHVTQQDA